jgi:predicted nucleotidyltransferase
MKLAEIKRHIRDFFHRDHRGVVAAYVFGSAARRTPEPHDVDIAVLLEEDPPPTLEGLRFDLAADLENVLEATVDLVVLNRAPVDLTHRVLRDGLLAFEGDRSRRIAFEVRVRNEFFDLEPILKRYRQSRGDRP